jgi:hypothetical protein
MDYGKVLSRAWEITWRWKVLWILGFLASLGRGFNTGNYSYTTDSSDWGTTYGPYIPPGIIAMLVGIVCLALIIGIALWVVSIIARGGLIAGVQQVEDEGSTSFKQAWRVGASRFWTLFGISILAALPAFILVVLGIATLALLIFGTVTAFDTSDAAGITGIVASVLCGGVACCGAILLAMVLDQIRIYAERAAILEGLGWIEAFKRGWQVLKENLGPTIVFWFIFLAIALVFGGVVMGGLAILIIPFIAMFSAGDPGPWIAVPICFGGALAAIVFALVGSVVETFTSSTWTLVYRELTGLATPPGAEPAAEPMAE